MNTYLPKSVWIINHYAQLPDEDGSARHFLISKHLGNFDWKCHIVAANTNYLTGKRRSDSTERVNCEGVSYTFISTPPYSENGLSRFAGMVIFSLFAFVPPTTRHLPEPNAVIGSSAHPFAALSAALIARRKKVPFVFEVRDLWPETLVSFGKLNPKSVVTRLFYSLEKWLATEAKLTLVLMPGAIDYYLGLGIPREKLLWLPNGTSFSSCSATPSAHANETFTVMYFGAHGEPNNLDTLINAFSELKSRGVSGVVARLIGEGREKPRLQTKAQDLNLNNVFFEEPVPKEALAEVAQQADAFVLCIADHPKLYRYGFSMNKLFDYMQLGKPVIICTNTDYNPISEAGAGVTVPAENPSSLADAIVQLMAKSQAERNLMGDKGRTYVQEKHSYAALASTLAKNLDSLL